jgi:Cytochrome P450
MIAGVDPTATNMGWGLKYLAKHNDVQTRLRKDLREVFPSALQEGKNPSADDITKARIPYLNAFIDEVLRHSGGQPTNVRVAISDTEILGYHIPKGTDIFMLVNIPPSLYRAFPLLHTCWSCHDQPLMTNPMQAPDTNHINRRWARATSPPPCLLTRASEAKVLANSKKIARDGLMRTSAASTPTAGWSEMSKARSSSTVARLQCKRLELV